MLCGRFCLVRVRRGTVADICPRRPIQSPLIFYNKKNVTSAKELHNKSCVAVVCVRFSFSLKFAGSMPSLADLGKNYTRRRLGVRQLNTPQKNVSGKTFPSPTVEIRTDELQSDEASIYRNPQGQIYSMYSLGLLINHLLVEIPGIRQSSVFYRLLNKRTYLACTSYRFLFRISPISSGGGVIITDSMQSSTLRATAWCADKTSK